MSNTKEDELNNIDKPFCFTNEFIEYIKKDMPKNKWLDFSIKLYTDGKDVYLKNICIAIKSL